MSSLASYHLCAEPYGATGRPGDGVVQTTHTHKELELLQCCKLGEVSEFEALLSDGVRARSSTSRPGEV